jgi:2-dehydropantoate 2-reductase
MKRGLTKVDFDKSMILKSLFTGAGVLGSLLAARLTQAGQDVYLLARGDRLVDLRQNGIRLQDMLTGQQENVQINLIERSAL